MAFTEPNTNLVLQELTELISDKNLENGFENLFREALVSSLYSIIYKYYNANNVADRIVFEDQDFEDDIKEVFVANCHLLIQDIQEQIKDISFVKNLSMPSSSEIEKLDFVDIKLPKSLTNIEYKLEYSETEKPKTELEMKEAVVDFKINFLQKKITKLEQKQTTFGEILNSFQNQELPVNDILSHIIQDFGHKNEQISQITNSWTKTYPIIQAVILVFIFEFDVMLGLNNNKNILDSELMIKQSELKNLDTADKTFPLIDNSPIKKLKKTVQEYLKYTSKRCDIGEVNLIYAICLSWARDRLTKI